jgi:hypothetical protein
MSSGTTDKIKGATNEAVGKAKRAGTLGGTNGPTRPLHHRSASLRSFHTENFIRTGVNLPMD